MALTLQPVRVASGEDNEGRLVFNDGWLVAVLVRLSEQHEERSGAWFLEKGFGVLDGPESPTFETLDLAEAWILRELARTLLFRPKRGP